MIDRLPYVIRRQLAWDGDCLLWTGTQTWNGYGCLTFGGRTWMIHRLVYTLLVGPIPEGRELDHVRERSCNSRLCVNLDHLEPVTHAENVRRSAAGKINNAQTRKERCPKGHVYSATLQIRDGRSRSRICHECRRDAQRRYMARRRAESS